MNLHIKYMVSNRCKMAVKAVLADMGFHFVFIDLGEVEIMETPSPEEIVQLKSALLQSGLELMDDKKGVLVEQMKTIIKNLIYHADSLDKVVFSEILSKELNIEYPALALLFSEAQGSTITQFIINHKIERIKELICYGGMNMTEIAWKLNYSSVAHLSNQFKKVTGLSPNHFKQRTAVV